MNFLWHFDERNKKYHNSKYKTFRSKNQVLYKDKVGEIFPTIMSMDVVVMLNMN
jgi:hypothetical protein